MIDDQLLYRTEHLKRTMINKFNTEVHITNKNIKIPNDDNEFKGR